MENQGWWDDVKEKAWKEETKKQVYNIQQLFKKQLAVNSSVNSFVMSQDKTFISFIYFKIKISISIHNLKLIIIFLFKFK